MNKPLLLWDFDGVIANSYQFVYDYWDQALATRGYQFSVDYYEATFEAKFPFDYLEETFPGVAAEIKAHYTQHEQENYPTNVQPFPGFVPNFKTIAPQFEHHIISSNLEGVITPCLKNYGLEHYFSSVLGRETPGYKDEKITKLLSSLGRDKADALFIGDTTSDIHHAQKAGLKNIAVSWGVHPRPKLETANPDTICDTIEELFKILTLSLRG